MGHIVFIIFLVLKLTSAINWNWFYVCIPLMIAALAQELISIKEVLNKRKSIR